MQKALFVKETGRPVVLNTRDVPEPKEGQVLIKVTSTMSELPSVLVARNPIEDLGATFFSGHLKLIEVIQSSPHDAYGRNIGLFIAHKLPYILGTNVAGIIKKLGPNVSTFCVRDRVFGEADVNYPTPDMAGLQEFAILDITATATTPPNLTIDQVATLPVNVVTSFITLFTPSGFNFPSPVMESSNANVSSFHNKSETLIIIGGGSNVGKLAIQFAKLAEIGTIIAIASGHREHELKRLGASHIIDRNSASIPAQPRDIVESNRLTHVYDCVNWTYELALDILTSDRSSQLATLHPIPEDMEQTIRQKRPQCQNKIIIGMSTNLEPFEN